MKNYLDKFSLTGKNAFVTGGLGLIGIEISKALIDAGAKVVVLDNDIKKARDAKKQFAKEGREFDFVYFNIARISSIETFVQKLVNKYKSIDVWVNAAYPRTKDWGNDIDKITATSWRKNVDMHLNGYGWTSRCVCLQMKKKNRGSLINLSSIYGVVGNDFTIYEGTKMTSPLAYSAIKGGIVNMDRNLASYFGKYNVRVNTVCPGGVFNDQNKIFVRKYIFKTPLRRMGKADEIASMVLFLASDASSYITGATIMVDGGWTAV